MTLLPSSDCHQKNLGIVGQHDLDHAAILGPVNNQGIYSSEVPLSEHRPVQSMLAGTPQSFWGALVSIAV